MPARVVYKSTYGEGVFFFTLPLDCVDTAVSVGECFSSPVWSARPQGFTIVHFFLPCGRHIYKVQIKILFTACVVTATTVS